MPRDDDRYPDFDADARRDAQTLIELAFAEDLGTDMPALQLDLPTGAMALDMVRHAPRAGDITAEATIPEKARGACRYVARSGGVIAGLPVLALCLKRFGLPQWFEPLVDEGASVAPGTAIAYVAGPMRVLLMAERMSLNFLQHLSGIATLTRRYVDAVAGTRATILDTRKTTPGWRSLEKYAVRQGGATNHRTGLFDAVLVKDNHLAWLAHLGDGDPIARAVAESRRLAPEAKFLEIEVDTLDGLDRAIEAGPDIVLLDNFAVPDLAEAVRRRDERRPGLRLEASGGVNLTTVRAIAETGVDRISVGALTHSAPALDIALDFERSDESP
jgi:nicotinate-nucleotide pyrophosphorylase (carboxylating)